MTERNDDGAESLFDDVGARPATEDDQELFTKDVEDVDAASMTSRYSEYPPAVLELFQYGARAKLVDVALELAYRDPHRALSKSELAERSGIARKTLYNHLDVLVEAGIFVENDGGGRTTYTVDPSARVIQILTDLNDELYSALGDAHGNDWSL